MAKEQVNVKLLRVSAVAPAIPTMNRRMFLSSLDLCFASYINNPRVSFYKINEEEMVFSTITEKLKSSLSLVLVDFYPFAGRLDVKGGESGQPEIDCNDGGVEFVEASIGMAFEDLEKYEFLHKSFFNDLVRSHDRYKSQHGAYDHGPLLSIQVTSFLGGGICIGANFHHVIADESSFWNFMKCWAECSRGLPISNKPEHMREIFKRDEKNYAVPNVSFKAEEVVTDRIKKARVFKFMRDDLLPKNHSEINLSTDDATVETINKSSAQMAKSIKDETEVLEILTFHFSEEMIRKLKDRARASTSFVAVTAHFWRCLTKARQVPENVHVDFGIVADHRGRVKPPLPPTYCGNCLSMGVARTGAKQLLGKDISFAASLIQELINSCTTEEQLNNMIDWPFSNRLRASSKVAETLGACRYSASVASSPKFPVYEIDHGWGKPLNVQPASLQVGVISLIGGRDENGGRSIDVSTCLPRG